MSAAASRPELSDPTRLGRLLSRLENDPDSAGEVLAKLPAPPKGTHRIGVTGSPGVGKSTLIRGLIRRYRALGSRVGVVAVDPTSPFSGGAILGDRVRLADTQSDEGVFIRSLGSRGSLGGVTPGASAVATVLEAAGYDRVLIETVGVGQTGYDVICLADTVIALFSPEGGDGVQLLKAGILEVGDIFAVNKSDRPGSDLMIREILTSMEMNMLSAGDSLHHGPAVGGRDHPVEDGGWEPPVVKLIARDEEGVAELQAGADQHRDWLAGLPDGHPRKRRRVSRELAFVMRSRLGRLLDVTLAGEVDSLAAEVYKGELELWRAVELLRDRLAHRI